MLPHARAAHSSATVRENQLLVYGGSIGSNYFMLLFFKLKKRLFI